MNAKLSTKTIRRCLWMGALLLSAAAASADTQLTFQVDMSAQLASGAFSPGVGDLVWAQGSFNGWGHLNLVVSANTNIYTNSFDDTSDANGGVVSYKFGDTQQNYESPADYDNRAAILPATSGASLKIGRAHV